MVFEAFDINFTIKVIDKYYYCKWYYFLDESLKHKLIVVCLPSRGLSIKVRRSRDGTWCSCGVGCSSVS